MATQVYSKSNLCSNPNKKVRIVAKIRGFTPHESQSSKPWISSSKSNQSDRVVVSFTGDNQTSRKDVYEVDHCYEQNEGMDLIFSREIKPLIPDVFNGKKATFIGFGARGSGKTYAIQGSDENPGLATLTVAEILSRAEEAGKFVTISVYEAFQEHVYDILDPSRPEIQVLENAQGKIKLKGLSEVSVKSFTEFQKLYHGECSTVKTIQKTALEQPQRSHKGLMIHILSRDETSNTKLVGKINFVDLAGYEDCRRKGENSGKSISFNNVESTKINRSLYAFLNVVHALNANEIRVPYRESKLTRVLQDSLGGTNHVLILTCMNPLVCQDTVYAMSLASRACQGIIHVLTDSTNRSKSSSKPTVASSMKKVKPASLSATTKKHTNSGVNLSQKKSSSTIEGRKLFVDRNESVTLEQETLSASVSERRELTTMVEKEDLKKEENHIEDALCAQSNDIEALTLFEGDIVQMDANNVVVDEGDIVQVDASNVVVDEGGSPPLSARLKELSNDLKTLCSSTPICLTKPPEVATPYSGQFVRFVDCVEPKTPIVERDNNITNFASPREAFSACSIGMKDSLVQGCLQFLNSASKEDLKGLWGIGEKRATYIVELREESPEPFKSLDDLQDIGMSEKQIKGMMRSVAGGIFI